MTRDMSRNQFKQAIKRRGWRWELLWIAGTGKDGNRTNIGMVMTRRTRVGWKINYRASLAKASRELRDDQ